jgi:pimeloyl-ACP methyl ester carboxylesterase
MSLRHEPVEVVVDGQEIGGSIIFSERARGPIPGALFVHGWGGSQGQYLARARIVAALGFVCLIFDLRGHEKTRAHQDAVTREDNLRDVVAAHDVLVNHPAVDESRIALIGSSYGAYLGALATVLRPVRWLALRAPAIYKDDGWTLSKRALHLDPEFAAYRRRSQRPSDNRALDACARFRGDALIVESQDDSTVPHPVVASYVAAFANANSLTYRVIEGADHGLSREPWKAAYTDLLAAWLHEVREKAAEVPQVPIAAAPRVPEEN